MRVHAHGSGMGYFVELVEYKVFTEVNTKDKLERTVNDLIFELFSIDKKDQSQIMYKFAHGLEVNPEKIKSFVVMTTPSMFKTRFSQNVC